MNNHEAKLILQGYRPGGQDAKDPHFKEALDQAKQDPELGAWLAKEQAVDSAITSKIQTFPVPEDLKFEIMVGHRIEKLPMWRRSRVLMALMACITIGFFALYFINASKAVPFDSMQKDIAQFTDKHQFNPPHKTENAKEIRQWLVKDSGHPAYAVPVGMKELKNIGCEVREFHGQKVSVICFWIDKDKRQAAHLFVVNRSALKDLPLKPRFYQYGKAVSVGWSDDKYAYVLSGTGKKEDIARFL